MPPRPLVAALLLAGIASAPPAEATFGGWILRFESGSTRLTEVADRLIREMFAPYAKFAIENGDVVVIQAHTDRVGSREANQRLSCARARALKARFAAIGYPPDRIFIYGYGEDRPRVVTVDEVAEPENHYADIELMPREYAPTVVTAGALSSAPAPGKPSACVPVDPHAC